jgi:iron complex transport system substrate-binding protein
MRVVSLLPSATEILFAIGAGDEVVGVTHECDFPAEALRLPKLTAASGPDLAAPAEIDRHVRASVHAGSSLYRLDSALLERLQPDLIVTQELCAVCAVSYEMVDVAAKRLRSDPRVVSLEPVSLDGVLATIVTLGELTGHAGQARELVACLEARVAALRDRTTRSAHRPRTLTLEWSDPPMSAGHWIPGLIELAGGEPLLAHPGANSRRLEWEAIAAASPEAVIVSPCGFDLARTRRAIADLDSKEQWRILEARKTGRVLAMDGNAYLSRPGPRLVEAAEMIAEWYTAGAEYAG